MPGSEHSWSVRVRVDHEVVIRIDNPLSRLRERIPEARRVQWGALDPEEDGVDALTVELSAPDPASARVRVQDALGRMLSDAGLPPVQLPIVWVAPLGEGPESSLRFLAQAPDLLEQELPEMAVVAAQVQIEVQMLASLRVLVQADRSPVASALLASDSPWTAMHAWQKDLLELLLGKRPSDDFPDWKAYAAHVQRRNAIVHRGQAVSIEDAAASLDVCRSFWEWLNERTVAAAEAHRLG